MAGEVPAGVHLVSPIPRCFSSLWETRATTDFTHGDQWKYSVRARLVSQIRALDWSL